jgi:hypothetical protein
MDTYDPTELGRLAAKLNAAANEARAISARCRLNGESDVADRHSRRASDAQYFAQVCLYFEGKHKTKAKRGAFQPPTFGQLLDFTRTDETCHGWPEADVQQWYDHFESNGWRVSGVTRMVDWKAAARNGARRCIRKQAKTPADRTDSDPVGWMEFLRTHGAAAAARSREKGPGNYRYAPDWLKDEFRRTRKAK